MSDTLVGTPDPDPRRHDRSNGPKNGNMATITAKQAKALQDAQQQRGRFDLRVAPLRPQARQRCGRGRKQHERALERREMRPAACPLVPLHGIETGRRQRCGCKPLRRTIP